MKVLVPEGRRSVLPALGYLWPWPFVFALAGLATPGAVVPAAIALNGALILGALVLGTILHELGHAGVATLTDMHVSHMYLGRGRALAAAQARGVWLVLQAVPFSAITYIHPRSPGWLRARLALVYVAGPATNLLLLLPVAWLWPPASLASLVLAPAPALVFILVQGFLFVSNAIPAQNKKTAPGRPGGTDGLMAFRALALSRLECDRLLSSHPYLLGVETLRTTGSYAAAEVLFRRAHELAPQQDPFAAALGECILMQHRYAEALPLVRRGLRITQEPLLVALYKNNIAWCLAMLGDAGSLDEARRFSAEATAQFPERHEFVGTSGAVLLLLGGDVDGAQTLLEAALAKHPKSSVNACLTASLLAVCHVRKGARARAEELLAAARTFTGHEALPAYVRASLEMAQDQSA